jgi:hypothetical protein
VRDALVLERLQALGQVEQREQLAGREIIDPQQVAAA